MGLYDSLKTVGNAARKFNEEAQEAYEEAMEMDAEKLVKEIKSGRGSNSRRTGYIKAAKQRGLYR